MAFTHEPATWERDCQTIVSQGTVRLIPSVSKPRSHESATRQYLAPLKAQPWPDKRPPAGGLLADPSSAFAEAVKARLQRDHDHAELVVPSVPAHHAAALYAHRAHTVVELGIEKQRLKRLQKENG